MRDELQRERLRQTDSAEFAARVGEVALTALEAGLAVHLNDVGQMIRV